MFAELQKLQNEKKSLLKLIYISILIETVLPDRTRFVSTPTPTAREAAAGMLSSYTYSQTVRPFVKLQK